MAFEPWVTRILDTGAAEIWIPGHDIAPGFQYSFVLFGSRLLDEDRGAGRRFLRAYLEGVERYIDEAKSPRLIEILSRRTRLDADLLRRACWPPTVRDGGVDLASIERYQAWAAKQGLIDVRLDLAKLVDAGLLVPPSSADGP
jgi:ABC-type nitrate/sulfonate/bicarbonate transport system substrate-binding protein